jgi:hypothetical protein
MPIYSVRNVGYDFLLFFNSTSVHSSLLLLLNLKKKIPLTGYGSVKNRKWCHVEQKLLQWSLSLAKASYLSPTLVTGHTHKWFCTGYWWCMKNFVPPQGPGYNEQVREDDGMHDLYWVLLHPSVNWSSVFNYLYSHEHIDNGGTVRC